MARPILRPSIHLVYHLAAEARRPPHWLLAVTPDHHVSRLRTGLGQLARRTSLRWLDGSTLALLVRYRADGLYTRVRHQELLDQVCQAIGWAGLYPTAAIVNRVATHWTHGAIAGALTGLGLSQTQDDDVQPAIALAAVFAGAVLGGFLRRDVPVYRAAQLPAIGWRLIAVEPESSHNSYRLGRA